MGVDDVLHRLVGELGQGRLDLGVQRRVLGIDQDNPVVADDSSHVAAIALQHPGLVAKIGSLDLHRVHIGLSHGRSGQKGDGSRKGDGCNAVHGRGSPN